MTFSQEERTENEIFMEHKEGLEALDRSLRDICNCEKPFGGLIPADPASFQNWHSRRTQGMRKIILPLA